MFNHVLNRYEAHLVAPRQAAAPETEAVGVDLLSVDINSVTAQLAIAFQPIDGQATRQECRGERIALSNRHIIRIDQIATIAVAVVS